MYHDQECCEVVEIADIVGDLNDLIGNKIIKAEEVTQIGSDGEWTHYTSTFYKIQSTTGNVTISWRGESNGYYSEKVDFERIDLEC